MKVFFFPSKEVIEFIPHLCSQNKDLQALQARAPYAPLPHTHTKHAHTRGREWEYFFDCCFFFLHFFTELSKAQSEAEAKAKAEADAEAAANAVLEKEKAYMEKRKNKK